MYVEPQINTAYEELFSTPLEEGYSNVAKLGKEKLLFAAREGLRGVRGRVSLVPSEISIEPVLLAGAMALLEQVGQYDLVLDLAEQEVSLLGAAALRNANRDTLRDFERDVVIATALAQCGLAREAFDAGQAGQGCARMEEALRLLRQVSTPAPMFGRAAPPLAPKLQQEISEALLELKAEALLGYLQAPPDSEHALAKRTQAVSSLKSMVQQPPSQAGVPALPPPAGGGNGAAAPGGDGAQPQSGAAGQYLRRALPLLTSWEVCELLDWDRVATSKEGFGWYYPGLLESAAVAHVVAGFSQRRPALIDMALRLLLAVRQESDVAVELAVCEVLLGSPEAALQLLREDERIGMALGGQAGPPAATAAVAATAAPSSDFPPRDGVMQFIRQLSPQGEADPLPGLCLFVEKWLMRMAFPRLLDTAQRPPLPSLVPYFQDQHVQAYLSRREAEGGSASSLSPLARAAPLGSPKPLGALLWVLALAAVAAVAAVTGRAWWRDQAANGPGSTSSAAVPATAAAAPSPAAPVQRQPQQGQSAKQQAAPKAAAAKQAKQQQQQQVDAVLSKQAAEQVVKQWLRLKAEAMGPRHATQGLALVLEDPMLGQVAAEVEEARAAGWFWNIRPLSSKVEKIDGSKLGASGGGHAVVLATVDESADLWATNGKKGDSYRTTYKVEYTVVNSKGAWKIANALVLGK